MVSSDHLLAFAATAFVVIVIPGPSVLFIVSRALGSGRRVAALSVVGNTLGEYLQVIAVAFGLGALAEQSVTAFTILKLVGGIYLVYLGIKTFRERKSLANHMAQRIESITGRRSLLQGFFVGVTNPKTVIFLGAILPQFVVRASGHLPEQILMLGAIFSAIALVSDTLWAFAAGAFRSWFGRSPRRLELVGGTGGIAIIAIGIRLAVSGRQV